MEVQTKETTDINEAIEKIDKNIDKLLLKLRTNEWCKLTGTRRRNLEEQVNKLAFNAQTLREKKHGKLIRYRSYHDPTPSTIEETEELNRLIG